MRNLTIAAALLMGSSSALAQTGQPAATDSQPASVADEAAASSIGAGASAASPTTTPSTAAQLPDAPTTAADTASASTIGGGSVAAPASPSMSATATSSAQADSPAGAAATGQPLGPLDFAMQIDSRTGAKAERERANRGAGNSAVRLLNATAADFSKADTNRDRQIDAAEMAAWQSGGASASVAPTGSITSGAGTMTPMPSGTTDAAAPADAGVTMTPPEAETMAPPEASNAPDGQMADEPMATDTPPKN